ncbi:MAG: hypothetical protein HYZ15_13045 [Sphingobacteriales bacterium]|nr:hypothetical protein [Sphingobacteriales bacterium]
MTVYNTVSFVPVITPDKITFDRIGKVDEIEITAEQAAQLNALNYRNTLDGKCEPTYFFQLDSEPDPEPIHLNQVREFNQVTFRREEYSREDGSIVVAFVKTGEAKRVKVTPAQAKTLNAGKMEHAGNIVFDYLTFDNEPGPKRITLGKPAA